jgi:hypothetical protein
MKTKYIDGNPEVCLQSGRSRRFPTLAQRCRQRVSITPHLAAKDQSRDAIGQKTQPHTFTHDQSHLD